MRLLVVEDNDELATLMLEGLGKANFPADRAGRADEARHMIAETSYSTVVLDLGLPDDDGLEILREMRERNDPTPVLILTARAGVQDRIAGLRAGADDYLPKPFDFEEFIARIEALLRRPAQLVGVSLNIGDLTLDLASRQAHVGTEPQTFSVREISVLEILMRRKGKVVSKRLIEDFLFGLSGDVSSNAVEVYVHRLRKQLSEKTDKVQIHTIRGVGYMIAEVV